MGMSSVRGTLARKTPQLPAAPAYVAPPAYALAVVLVALYVAIAIPAIQGQAWGGPLLYGGAIALTVVAILIQNHRKAQGAKIYVPGRMAQTQTVIEDAAEREKEANLAWGRQYTAHGFLAFFVIALAVYYLVTSWMVAGNALDYFKSIGWHWFFAWVLAVLAFVGSCFLLVVPAMSPVAAIARPRFTYDALIGKADIELDPIDQNDIEIVKLDVDVATANKRVDTYTLESTLLSALAFSAFVGILMAEKVTLEGINWLAETPMQCQAMSLYSFSQTLCWPMLNQDFLSAHIVSAISLCLLLCSVFLLAVLVTRLRFNEAIRYVEEDLGKAKALNGKEEALNAQRDDRTTNYLEQIAKLIEQARLGQSDLRSMTGFMKIFRDVGILFFIFAISLCGLYFSPYLSLCILGVFAGAFLFGWADKLRRRLTLRRLTERVRGFGHKK